MDMYNTYIFFLSDLPLPSQTQHAQRSRDLPPLPCRPSEAQPATPSMPLVSSYAEALSFLSVFSHFVCVFFVITQKIKDVKERCKFPLHLGQTFCN